MIFGGFVPNRQSRAMNREFARWDNSSAGNLARDHGFGSGWHPFQPAMLAERVVRLAKSIFTARITPREI